MALFSNSFTGSVAIPDNNPVGITNILAISGVPTGAFLREIRVMLNITHTFDADLDIFLFDPDGNQIELSTDNGLSGDNFVNTVFVDSAATAITAGDAPFTGNFRPEQALSQLYPGAINGNWSLKIVDDLGADVGNLTNWSIDLSFGEASVSINPFPASDSRSTIAVSRDGRYSISFSEGSLNGGSDVVNLFYAANGTGTFSSGIPLAAFESSAATTYLRDGRQFLSYVSNASGNQDINVVVFSNDAFPFQVASAVIAAAGNQVSPVVAELSDGNVVVVYADLASDRMQARIFNTTTNTFGAAIAISAAADPLGIYPNPSLQPANLIALVDGGFAVTFAQAESHRFAIFDNAGGTVLASRYVNTNISTNPHSPFGLTQLNDGSIMLVGQTPSSDFSTNIYTSTGTFLGGSGGSLGIPSNAFYNVRATTLLDGRVMVVGSSVAEGGVVGTDIWGQVINPNGIRDGAAFRINGDNLVGTQDAPDIATLADGRVVVTWTDHITGNGDIMQQIIDIRSTGVNLTGYQSLDETWIGSRFADSMNGGLGNDVITGGAGDDIINGGAGTDVAVYNYSGSSVGYFVKWGGSAADFKFTFGTDGTDTLQGIETVRIVQTGGTTLNLLPLNLTKYYNGEVLGINAYGTSNDSGGWANNDLYTRRIGDVNGDNRADIIAFGSDFAYVSLGQVNGTFSNPIVGINSFGSGVNGGGWVSNNVYLRQIADVNGDGRADIVGFGSDYTYVSLGQANGTFASPIIGINSFGASIAAGGWTNNNLYERELGDVNGDGRADIVGFGSDYTYVALGQANGTFANPIIGIAGFGASGAGGGWTSFNQYPRMVGDISGDGRADIVGFGADGVFVSLGQANGTFGATVLVASAFGTGQGWSTQDLMPRMLGDLNGDGRMDIIAFGTSGTYGALALPGGTGFSDIAFMTSSFGAGPEDGLWDRNLINPRVVGDVDGNGRADLIGFGTSGALVTPNNSDYFVI
jgi:subtilisin-like proprotein convertase family protein